MRNLIETHSAHTRLSTEETPNRNGATNGEPSGKAGAAALLFVGNQKNSLISTSE